ncbi:DUF4281 domain-containing protein [Putridiphycobacter roseus]|uniref:DUF4281 domain-containing protein n=1 Tax=Putridiphycobacter roseus TaxID=2219161 RepID=A0A2W1N4T6_9FLAO|nr:ABA4-like family protein [Putridiphycobacter roseus]PZE18111.1 DUF4281 domain-containing protein [Putridiphycobacter roseus]
MEALFYVLNGFTIVGWLLIVFFPNYTGVLKISKYWIVGILSLAYLLMIPILVKHFDGEIFYDYSHLIALLNIKTILLACWIHYLAFDLFVGVYIVETSVKLGIKRGVYLPCLLLTLFFGPIGLLAFYIQFFIRK